MNHHDLKQLRERRIRLESERKTAKDNRIRAQQEEVRLTNEISKITAEIDKQEGAEPSVSEHAVVRYAERVMGLDPEAVRAQILTQEIRNIINTVGTGKAPLGNGLSIVFRNKVVVTVVKAEEGIK